MKNFRLHQPLDLIEVRRQLIAIRSLHSNDRRVTSAVNGLIGKLAHLHQPESRKHEERLLHTITKTIQRIDDFLSNGPQPSG